MESFAIRFVLAKVLRHKWSAGFCVKTKAEKTKNLAFRMVMYLRVVQMFVTAKPAQLGFHLASSSTRANFCSKLLCVFESEKLNWKQFLWIYIYIYQQEAYSESRQIYFCENAAYSSILDVWQGSEYTTERDLNIFQFMLNQYQVFFVPA